MNRLSSYLKDNQQKPVKAGVMKFKYGIFFLLLVIVLRFSTHFD